MWKGREKITGISFTIMQWSKIEEEAQKKLSTKRAATYLQIEKCLFYAKVAPPS